MEVKVTDAGCDWLTLTDKEASGKLLELYLASNESSELEYWQWLMYVGYSREQRYYGKSYQGELVQLRGYAAKEDYGFYAPDSSHCSRVDWQVTFDLAQRNPRYIDGLRDECLNYRTSKAGKWKITYVNGCGQGDTLYLGSRSSEAFVRVYDKGAQSGELEDGISIRIEIEFKGEKACRSIENQLSSCTTQQQYALSVVKAFSTTKGLSTHWSNTYSAALPKGKYVPDDVKRKLKWLSKSVAPALAQLRLLGYGSEAYSMLGIPLTDFHNPVIIANS